MIPWAQDTASFCVGYLGRAIKSSKGSEPSVYGIQIATVSIAEILVGLISKKVATDISTIKNNLIRRLEAQTIAIEKETEKRVTTAAEAANKLTIQQQS